MPWAKFVANFLVFCQVVISTCKNQPSPKAKSTRNYALYQNFDKNFYIELNFQNSVVGWKIQKVRHIQATIVGFRKVKQLVTSHAIVSLKFVAEFATLFIWFRVTHMYVTISVHIKLEEQQQTWIGEGINYRNISVSKISLWKHILYWPF